MTLKTLIAAAMLAFAITGSAAASVYDFTYTTSDGPSGMEYGHGVVTISNTETDGHYDILSITGFGNGSAITGLSPYAASDNFVFPSGPALDLGGVSFATKSGIDYNFYFYNNDYFVLSSFFDSVGYPQNGSQINGGSITFISSAVPETATWVLLIAGIGGMGLMLRRARNPSGNGAVSSPAVW